jgi:ubiquinol-cytochrome c reductase cytochrome b subunit
VLWGATFSFNIIVPLLILPIFLAAVAFYPFIEAWVTGDKREHHIADRPRNAPTRTAIGAAGVTFYAVLWAAAGSDLIATHFHLTIEGVIISCQVLLILGPIIAYYVTKRVCISLQKKDREIALHGFESGRIVRMPGGEYVEVHEQLSDYDRWKLVAHENYKPLMLRPNEDGRITNGNRLRTSLSKWFFEDRIAPATKGELEQGSHGEH